jgi:hypothetical protein
MVLHQYSAVERSSAGYRDGQGALCTMRRMRRLILPKSGSCIGRKLEAPMLSIGRSVGTLSDAPASAARHDPAAEAGSRWTLAADDTHS